MYDFLDGQSLLLAILLLLISKNYIYMFYMYAHEYFLLYVLHMCIYEITNTSLKTVFEKIPRLNSEILLDDIML